MHHFDLIVIGSGPGGQRAATQAAKLRKRVAVCERRRDVGGVSINSGTIPSKTLREAVIDLSGLRQRTLYGESFRAKRQIRVEDLLLRAHHVMRAERDVVRGQLRRNGITLFEGMARFGGPHDVAVDTGSDLIRLNATNVVIATGSAPAVPPGLTVDHHTVLNYPTLAECYKVAALDGCNKLRELASAGAVSPGSTAGAQPNEEATPRGAKGLGDLTAVSAHGALSRPDGGTDEQDAAADCNDSYDDRRGRHRNGGDRDGGCPFRFELAQTDSHRGLGVEGYVYNGLPWRISNVRLRLESVDVNGAVTASASGWVIGDVKAGGRGYFYVAVSSPATTYRATVQSFDKVAVEAPRFEAP